MDAQLREELEFTPQSEALNCLVEASAVASSLGRELRQQANMVVSSGRVAVLTMAPYFCKSTDAFAGEYPCHLDVADSVWEARSIATQIEERDEDLRAELVIPDALKPAPAVFVTVDDSDIPF
jgi:hypothetical protein